MKKRRLPIPPGPPTRALLGLPDQTDEARLQEALARGLLKFIENLPSLCKRYSVDLRAADEAGGDGLYVLLLKVLWKHERWVFEEEEPSSSEVLAPMLARAVEAAQPPGGQITDTEALKLLEPFLKAFNLGERRQVELLEEGRETIGLKRPRGRPKKIRPRGA